jgi:hypothetical protein
MSQGNNCGAFLTGFLLGGLAGAAAALLMTPQPGETTRVQLRERGIELKGRFDDLSSGIQERGRVIVEEKLPGHSRAPGGHGEEPTATETGETSELEPAE